MISLIFTSFTTLDLGKFVTNDCQDQDQSEEEIVNLARGLSALTSLPYPATMSLTELLSQTVIFIFQDLGQTNGVHRLFI